MSYLPARGGTLVGMAEDLATPDRVASSATAAETTPVRMLAAEFGLALLQDEQVIVHGEPQRERLLRYILWISACTIVALPFLPIVWIIARAFVRKHRYWLTSSRVVVTNGIIGYRARSIPLERISDVAISCNWLERALGLRSVIVRDMTGEALSGAAMLAAPDAGTLQRQILDQVHNVNRRVSSADNDRMHVRGYREIVDGHTQQDTLELLRRIEANTRPPS